MFLGEFGGPIGSCEVSLTTVPKTKESAAPQMPPAIFPKVARVAWSLVFTCSGQHLTLILRACNQLQGELLNLSYPALIHLYYICIRVGPKGVRAK